MLFGGHSVAVFDENGEVVIGHSPENNIAHFSRNSARYNGILSISATGIDNGKGGGWERIRGPHAVKLCGRTYHYLPKTNSSGGIQHFILDKYTEALMHGKSLQTKTSEKLDTEIKDTILRPLWDTLHQTNRFVQHCKIIGEAVRIINDQNYPEEPYAPAQIAFTPEVITQINSVGNVPHLLDVASVTDDSAIGKRVIHFKLKNTRQWQKLPITHQHIEPLSYPVLFLAGEDGWGIDLKREVHFPNYIVSRMLMPEEDLFVRNAANTKYIQTNRFQLFARVAQYWLCDCVSRSIENRLEWMRNNQSYITNAEPTLQQLQNGLEGNGGEADLPEPSVEEDNMADNIMEALHDDDNAIDYTLGGLERGDNVAEDNSDIESSDRKENNLCAMQLTPDQPGYRETGKTYLNSHFHGSRRHLRKLSTNGLIVVSQKGNPHLFITLTCNSEWPEIKDRLFYGQTAFDRPDVTTQVFRARLAAFKQNLRAGKYFRDDTQLWSTHEIEYEMMCIEYQHRGLPHAHLVVRLSNMPLEEDKEGQLRWIKKHIHSCAPRLDDCEYFTTARRDLVRKHMLHTCSSAENGCLKNGICKRRYDTLVVNGGEPSFGHLHFPVYGRREEEDLRIVPHHVYILEDWDGHVNVEYCGSHYTPIYLYKYVFKGAKKEKFRLTNADDIADDDEINLHIRAQVISSMDSMWRVMGYSTYPATHPSVIIVHAQTPETIQQYATDGKVTDLYVYLNRPQLIRTGTTEPLPPEHKGKTMNELTYLEFYTIYCYSRKLRKSKQNKPTDEGRLWWKLTLPNGVELFVTKRERPDECIVRMNMLYSSAGEVYYLRLLLNTYPTRTLKDFLTRHYSNGLENEANAADNHSAGEVNENGEIQYIRAANTFQEACLFNGLLNDVKEAMTCFEYAMITGTPPLLRNLFITQTVQGFPTIQIFNDPQKRRAMSLDFISRHRQGFNSRLALNDLLTDLAERMNGENKKLSDYGLPESENVKTELELERLKYDAAFQAQLLQQLNQSHPNNPEQQEVFDYITNEIDNINPEKATYIFLNGPAGSGKSCLTQKIMAYARSKEHIALGTASTNLAATNFKDFTSFHYCFRIPVLEDYEIEEGIKLQCRLKDKPGKEELILAATLIMCDEFPNLPKECFEAAAEHEIFDYFRGKIFIGIGDFQQIAPVVKFGSMEQIKMACIQNSKYWPSFQVRSLKTNMRLERLRQKVLQSIQYLEEKIESAQDNGNLPLIQKLKQDQETLVSDELGQREYARMILQIGSGNVDDTDQISFHAVDPTNFSTTYRYNPCKVFVLEDKEERETWLEYNDRSTDSKLKALHHFYPQGFQSHKMHTKTILAATNRQIDDWNSIVQKMNPNYSDYQETPKCLISFSSDVLSAVDDPRDVISRMLTTEMLNRFNSDKSPPHILKLCVGDICYLMRTLGRKTKLATNKRVRILELRKVAIKVQTIENDNSPGEVHFIPRIRFRFTLPYGESYEVTRTQFPLRLAYAVSINKSQGQQYEDILFDTTHQAFTHGHLYVALSRITKYNKICFFTYKSLVISDDNNEDKILLQNIVYPDLLTSIV